MDPGDLEPGHGLRQGLPGLRPLLRRGVRRALAWARWTPVPTRLRSTSLARATRTAVEVEASAADFRQLDERSLPRADTGRFRSRCVRCNGPGVAPHVPD